MDEDRLRAARYATGRHGAASDDEPKKAESHSASSTRRDSPSKKKSKKTLIAGIVVAAVLVIAGAVGWLTLSNVNSGVGIDGDKYQAVFFTNGQVYFGKLHELNDEYMRLTDVYYLQTASAEAEKENPQETSSSQNTTLIKLGNEIHGPEDEMVVSKNQVLFFENLKTDGKVAQTIEEYKKSN